MKISFEQLQQIIKAAISSANQKSSREILSISPDATEEEIEKVYEKEGRERFKYLKRYCSDPASAAYEIRGETCDIAPQLVKAKFRL